MKAKLRQKIYKLQGSAPDTDDFFADGGEVMDGIGSLNETARGMSRGPRGIGAYQQYAGGGPVYMQEGGDPVDKIRLSRKADIASRYRLNPEDSGLRNLYKKIPTNMRLFIENVLFGDTTTITEDDFTNDELIEIIDSIEKQKDVNAKEEQSLREETEKFLKLGMTYKPNQGYIMDDAGKLVPYDNYDTPLLTGTEALKTYEDTRDRTSVNPYAEPSYYSGTSGKMVDNNYRSSLARSFSDPRYNVATTLGKYTATDVDDGYNVRDTYNFNREERNLPTNLSGALQRILDSPELAGEYLANLLNSKPRDVDIDLKRINAANR